MNIQPHASARYGRIGLGCSSGMNEDSTMNQKYEELLDTLPELTVLGPAALIPGEIKSVSDEDTYAMLFIDLLKDSMSETWLKQAREKSSKDVALRAYAMARADALMALEEYRADPEKGRERLHMMLALDAMGWLNALEVNTGKAH